MKKFFVSLFVVCSAFSFSGCELLEMINSCVKRAFSTDEYDVSVIDSAVASSDGVLVQDKDAFNRYISSGMRQGVKKLSTKKGMSHIQLVDNIPSREFSKANQIFFSKEKDLSETVRYLRRLSESYSTNILVLGITAQDGESEAGRFAGWLYRRDLDLISGVPAKVRFTKEMDHREREARVAEAVALLLENSIKDADPIPTPFDDDRVKETIVEIGMSFLKLKAGEMAYNLLSEE